MTQVIRARQEGPLTKNIIVFRCRVAGPNAVSIHEEGGPARRLTGPCFLAGKLDLPACYDAQTTQIEKSAVTQKKRRKTPVREAAGVVCSWTKEKLGLEAQNRLSRCCSGRPSNDPSTGVGVCCLGAGGLPSQAQVGR